MIYITGDTHGDFNRIKEFCRNNETTKDDVLVILGDVGINFYPPSNHGTKKRKKQLSDLPITLFCIHGNHECRPGNISSYIITERFGAKVYIEEEYPNLLFAKDGEIYNINGNKCLVIGGAYSVDKYYRAYTWYQKVVEMDETVLTDLYNIVNGDDADENRIKELNAIIDRANPYDIGWWKDEQPDVITKSNILQLISKDNKFDYIFTHTCPMRAMPHDMFLSGINQMTVDNSTEEFLEKVYESTECKKWFCGHYHIDRTVDNIVFMFNDIRMLDEVYGCFDL